MIMGNAEDNENRSANSLFANIFLPLFKLLGVSTGVLYAVGLIVTTTRLAEFGVLSVEFAKPLYVLTGAWTLLPVFVVAVLITMHYGVANLYDSDTREHHF